MKSARAKKPPAKPRASKPAQRRRLPTEERERLIVDGAIEFFSECGLNGQMRELALRLGITHPLLFHYFPSKSALIQRVYEKVYLGRWRREWEVILKDRSAPLESRLTQVYVDYAETVLTKEWVRILIHSALADGYITDNYMALLNKRMIRPIVEATRAELGCGGGLAITEAENELVWGFHGGIFYIGVRHWIYGQPFPKDLAAVVKDRVRSYILAAAEVFPREAGSHSRAASE